MLTLPSTLLALVLPAQAQETQATPSIPELNAQLYRIPVDADRTLWTDDAGLAPDHHVRAKVGLIYAHDPLIFRNADDPTDEYGLLTDVLQTNVIGSYSFSRLRIGLDLPVYLLAASEVADGGGGLGDVAVDLKGTVLSRKLGAPVGVAIATRFGLPTATVDLPLGGAGLTWEASAIVDYEVGPVLLAANLGTIINPDVPGGDSAWSDQFLWRAGAGYAIDNDALYGISADLAGRISYANGFGTGASPAEWLLGGWSRFQDDWVARGGVGSGIGRGIGAPEFRMVLTVGYEPPALLDRDGDGVVDTSDACVSEPEDADGWQDADGCPDPSVRLTVQVVDPSGAPVDTATVKLVVEDGVAEVAPGATRDLHPGRWAVTVEAPGFALLEGQIIVPEGPDATTEVLQIEPLAGLVRMVVEDPEGQPVAGLFQVDGGGPVAVEDGGGEVEAPPGRHEVVVRADGFKPKTVLVQVAAGQPTETRVVLEPALATVTRDRIEIRDKVYFETNRAVIKPESYALLDEIAGLVADYPEVQKLRVDGHTDERGPAGYNRRLSQQRADAVRQYLINKGVDSSRIFARGAGEDEPLVKEKTDEAYEQNRRVEFVVVEWDASAREP